MKDGTCYQEECYDLKGSPQNPVGFDELVKKFRTAAEGVLSQQKVEELLSRCAAFDQEREISQFNDLLNW